MSDNVQTLVICVGALLVCLAVAAIILSNRCR